MAWQQEERDVSPDLMTIGKALGGGYAPIAGILVYEDIIAQLDRGTGCYNNGHTYQAHPMSCAALGVQKMIQRKNLIQWCSEMGKILETELRSLLADQEHVGNIRGRGLFWAVKFVKDRETKTSFDPSLKFGPAVQRQALEYGVNVYPGAGSIDGVRGDHVLIALPYTISEEEIKVIVATVLRAYTEVLKQM